MYSGKKIKTFICPLYNTACRKISPEFAIQALFNTRKHYLRVASKGNKCGPENEFVS